MESEEESKSLNPINEDDEGNEHRAPSDLGRDYGITGVKNDPRSMP